MRRLIVLPLLAIIGCASNVHLASVPHPCSQGNTYDKGIACINPANLEDARPYGVHTHRGGHVDFWLMQGSDELTVDSDVLENTGHDGPHAWGDVKKDAVVGQHYHYTAHKGAPMKADPEIIIDY
jgi:hypothetical protein